MLNYLNNKQINIPFESNQQMAIKNMIIHQVEVATVKIMDNARDINLDIEEAFPETVFGNPFALHFVLLISFLILDLV
jgi:hypothetical protein